MSDVGSSIASSPGSAWTDTGKTAVAEHLQHPVVLRQDERRERVDVAGARGGREVAEQDRRHASALQLVRDGERHLRASPTHVDRHRMGDDPLLLTDGRHETEAVDVVDVGGPRRGLLEVAAAGEEAEPARLGRKRLQEAEEAVAVRGADGANPDRGAVAQGDVGLELSGIRGGDHAKRLRNGRRRERRTSGSPAPMGDGAPLGGAGRRDCAADG